MSDPFKRKRQCKACPWKTSTVPGRDIPGGYDPKKHAALKVCQAQGLGAGLRIMACHESAAPNEYACVGWLWNQLGPGNNIALRLAGIGGRFKSLRVDGEQYETIDDMCDAADSVEDNL